MSTTEQRMGAFSAVMWDIEVDPILRNPITLVCMLDAVPDKQVVLDRAERMSRTNPKLRQRAIGNPVSLIPPRWEVDPNFDMTYHIRWSRPARSGGGLTDVLRIAQTVTEEDFDRSRPLWEMHLVTGLKGRRAAAILKVHHSITDGEGGVLMMGALFDLAREPADKGPLPPAPEGEVLGVADRVRQGIVVQGQTVVSDVTGIAKGGAGLVRQAVTDPVGSATVAQEYAASAARLTKPAPEPMSDIWTQRSLSVAFSVVEVPLADLKAAAKAASSTLNDVYMAMVARALYRYHEQHESHPEALRVNMPVSMRPSDGSGGGNQWVPARFPLPTNDQDPITQIRELHPILLQARTEPALGLSSVVYRLMAVLPNAVMAAADRAMMKGTDLAATNVPGPPIPLFLAGAEVVSMMFFAPKGGSAVNFGLFSYNGTAFVGINADTASVKDPAALTRAFKRAAADIAAIAQPAPAKAAR